MIFDQLIFNIENIMLLLIILPFIFTKVSKYLSLQYDMLQNISSWIIAILPSIVCWCIMIRHYITRSLSLNQISCIAFLQSLVSKFWFQRKNDFYFRRLTFSTTISNSISSLSASFHLFCSNKNFVWASLTRCCDDLPFISIKSFFVNTKRHYFNLVGILLSDKTFKWIQSTYATTVQWCFNMVKNKE